MSDKTEHLNKKQKIGITVGTTVGGILIIAAIVLALLFGCKPKSHPTPVEPTYTVTWKNWNGEILEEDTGLKEGDIPSYDGETPTRPDTQSSSFMFSGWNPTVVAVTRNATYTATFAETLHTLTVRFPDDTPIQYSQYVVEDVPWGTQPHFSGDEIEINGTVVTATWPSDDNNIYYFDRWSIAEDYIFQTDVTIEAIFLSSAHLYNLTISATGGGKIAVDSSGETENPVALYNAKAYEAIVVGTPDTQVSSEILELSSLWGEDNYSHHIEAININDGFFATSFVGWYCNGEPLMYETPLYGDLEIEARFAKTMIDYSYMFYFDCDYDAHECYIDGLQYPYSNGEVVTTIAIPETYDGCNVVGVKYGALGRVNLLQNIYIPKTVTYFEMLTDRSTFPQGLRTIRIDEENPAFTLVDGVLYTKDMKEVVVATLEIREYFDDDNLVIPDSVTSLWAYSLSSIYLRSIELPNTIEVIPAGCFLNNSLIDPVIPSSVKRIEKRAFSGCSTQTFHIPDTVEYIGDYAFQSCRSLERVYIGSGLKEMGRVPFEFCMDVKEYHVSGDNQYFASYDRCLYSKDLTILWVCPTGLEECPVLPAALKNVEECAFRYCSFAYCELPEGVERIGHGAFSDNENLVEIQLPSTVTYLGSAVFGECSKLEKITYKGTMAEWDAISKEYYWLNGITLTNVIHCSDGDAEITYGD